MFSPEWDEGCSSCSAGADEISDGTSCFLRDGDSVFHTYSMYARGAIPDFSA